MFERFIKAVEPFGLSVIVLAGLALIGRLPLVDRAILGYVTIAFGAALIVVHVTNAFKTSKSVNKRKD